MPEVRFFKIIIIVLLIINIGTLGFLWLGRGPKEHDRHHPPPGMGRPPEGGGAGAFLRESLQLTDKQESAYRSMREQHHETVMHIRDEMKQSKRALYALLKAPDRNAVQNEERVQLDSLAAQQRRIEAITYEHFREVRTLCTPEQQTKFDDVIGEALEQMR
jgi:Spy/CpxP family protein refolding chaperone